MGISLSAAMESWRHDLCIELRHLDRIVTFAIYSHMHNIETISNLEIPHITMK